jgi:DNA-binding response OmpR family regulator
MTFLGRRVLVVEDEFLVSLLTIDTLESVGCEIVGPAAQIAEAAKLAQSESLDAAILDVNVGGELIWPVAKELQRRSVPFLFLSATNQLTVFPPPFAAVPRLDKPMEKNLLLRHLSAMWDAVNRQQHNKHDQDAARRAGNPPA